MYCVDHNIKEITCPTSLANATNLKGCNIFKIKSAQPESNEIYEVVFVDSKKVVKCSGGTTLTKEEKEKFYVNSTVDILATPFFNKKYYVEGKV